MFAHGGLDFPTPGHRSVHRTGYALSEVRIDHADRSGTHASQEAHPRMQEGLPVVDGGTGEAGPLMQQAVQSLGHDVAEFLSRRALRIGEWVVAELRRIPAVPAESARRGGVVEEEPVFVVD